jgi:hypothetical protein
MRKDVKHPRVLYLNVEGGQFRHAKNASNSSTNVSSLVPHDMMLPVAKSVDRSQLASCVRDMFRDWNLSVVTNDPGEIPHLEAAVLGTVPESLGLEHNVAGIAPMSWDAQPVERGIGFIFAELCPTEESLCETVAHEVGHLLGLDHVLEPCDVMSYGNCDHLKTFTATAARCGAIQPSPCQGGTSQNAVAHLDQVLPRFPATQTTKPTIDEPNITGSSWNKAACDKSSGHLPGEATIQRSLSRDGSTLIVKVSSPGSGAGLECWLGLGEDMSDQIVKLSPQSESGTWGGSLSLVGSWEKPLTFGIMFFNRCSGEKAGMDTIFKIRARPATRISPQSVGEGTKTRNPTAAGPTGSSEESSNGDVTDEDSGEDADEN